MKEFAGKHFLLIVENNSVPLDARVWREANSLNDAGAVVSVISPIVREYTEKFIVINNIKIYRYKPVFSNGTAFGYLREYFVAFIKTLFLVHKVLFHNPHLDVIHVANPPDMFWPLGIYLRLFGVKFIFDEHDLSPEAYLSRFGKESEGGGIFYKIQIQMQKFSYKYSHAIISTNESYREKAKSLNPKYSSKTVVVRNGPDTRYFRESVPKPALKKGKLFLAAYLGVMGIQDGVDYIINAVNILVNNRNFRDFVVYLIGTGDDWQRLKQMSEKLGLDEFIIFTGFIPYEKVFEILSTADICLSPDPLNPLNDLSTMNKVMEYMALGKPIVSFDLKEARFSAGDSAIYVENNNPEAFADGIARLLRDPQLCSRMKAIGKKKIEEELCWQKQSENLLRVYRSLLQE